MSKSLLSFFKKERCEWFTCDSSNLLAKTSESLQKFIFFLYVFDSFSPFYAQERIAPVALHSIANSLFFKETTRAIPSFSQENCSFAHKNDRIAWKTNERKEKDIYSKELEEEKKGKGKKKNQQMKNKIRKEES